MDRGFAGHCACLCACNVGCGRRCPWAEGQTVGGLLGKLSFFFAQRVRFTGPFHFGLFIPLGINHLGFLRGAS